MKTSHVLSFFFGLFLCYVSTLRAQDKKTIQIKIEKRDDINLIFERAFQNEQVSSSSVKGSIQICSKKSKANYQLSFDQSPFEKMMNAHELYLTNGLLKRPIRKLSELKSMTKNLVCEEQSWYLIFEKKRRQGRFPASIQEEAPQSYTVFVAPN